MSAMANTSILTDPAALTPGQWSAKLAAYLARGRSDDDPDVIACRQAGAWWRVRRILDSERGRLNPADIPALADLLRHEHAHPVPGSARAVRSA
jgi:hypothetical protein